MLELSLKENEWEPPALSEEMIGRALGTIPEGERNGIWFVVMQASPYIDALLLAFREENVKGEAAGDCIEALRRFVFREHYAWNRELESLFREICLEEKGCQYDHDRMNEIFDHYAKAYPQWQLKRYYTNDFRMLDHIYQCCRQNTAKEILYKAGLDELAVQVEDLDEENLLAGSPSALYEGISMRCLRALNCKEGARMLNKKHGRDYVKGLQKRYPEIFGHRLNDAQCRYLAMLHKENLTVSEAGRLYLARSKKLMQIWCDAQYEIFRLSERVREDKQALVRLDPIYKNFLDKLPDGGYQNDRVALLKYYLLVNREKFDDEIRRSNRRRDPSWQERGENYLIRFPQTINDFCREAVYMSNCLFGYVDAMIANETTILFMRCSDDVNAPFITIEVFGNQLMQAYHRFNEACSDEEEAWILEYCKRHDIDTDQYHDGDLP